MMGKMRGAARALAVLAVTVSAGSASAQLISGVSVQPETVKPGEQATVTVQFDVVGGTHCGLRMHWGDGTTADYKINQAKDVPLVTRHAWPQPGRYQVKAEGKTQGMLAKCGGRTVEATLVVSAPAASIPSAPKASAPASTPRTAASKPATNASMAPTSPCPAGWTLNKPGVGKNGAYTCGAKAGTAAPAKRPECPGELTYFENTKRGQLGCRP